jgi:CHAD domain-containing protein
MAFKFVREESISDGTKRIVREQIDQALARTKGLKAASDDNVHDIRKRMKKIRAVLRLLRGELGNRIYRNENACFRDIARPLTEVRDARVLIDTLDSLNGRFNGEASSGSTYTQTRKALLNRQRAVRRRVLRKGLAFMAVKQALKEAHLRVDEWVIDNEGWPALRPGLKRIYQRGRHALAAAEADPTAEALHEWRKQAKYAWHHLQVLEPVWPEDIAELSKQFHGLTQLLGDDHDLAVLHQLLTTDPESFGGTQRAAVLAKLIGQRREELQRAAFLQGKRLYLDKPKIFADRLGGYWDIWRSENDGALG